MYYSKSKYRNVRVEVDGILFASMLEAQRYRELKMLEQCGKIKNLKLQPAFQVLDDYYRNGLKIRGIKYYADFAYIDENGEFVVEDVKGMETDVFKLKKKMFESTHENINLVIIKK